jgi:glucose/mannose-6-phosphate isomerase
VTASALNAEAVAAVDSTGQAAEMLDLGTHLRDALWRVDSAGLAPVDASGGMVVAGMGGSAVGGRLALGVLSGRARRPIAIADDYSLPGWVGQSTLVLCSSYSGATEETLACYDAAREAGASIVVATTGGPLAERARRDRVPVIPLPGGFQPRAAVGYALVAALEAAALGGAAPSLRDEVEAAAALADELAAEWGPAGVTAPVAYRWKCQINENSKLTAFWSTLPEADHNEVCGWDAAAELGAFSAVLLEDPGAHPRVALRFELTAALAGAGARVIARVPARGETPLDRLVSLVLLGDLVSLYLAVLRGADPVTIEALVTLKAQLAER